ncbi:thiamine-phosphate kinase [candidate division WOR-3 bacterium JGI_Cruoil_03_44_89]|mgnify:CR=1 FL=1|uniref:Thiamine-monophosphate kinase n=1 Tax=candidate division WOR-3 bacterium JGI_Cruoil_03_44_89 TaxID=1973748 RepID=A0A235BRB6_UNCW3|nr:MAG: thiamine-phosphate kinase [candidate division WOR-3 bacterium JGI_Cruoil_03_44_89]
MSTESEIINRLRILFPRIGDDAEEFNITPGFTPIVSIDSFVQGVHFDLSLISPHDVGYRSCAATLSDIAAMGGNPCSLLCALGMPEGSMTLAESLARGIRSLADDFDTAIIGGDTVKSSTLFVSLCVIGEGKKIVRRKGARVGDVLCVTAPLGGSAAGLKALKNGLNTFKEAKEKYIHPKPRIGEGLILSEYATSMIDVSDGLVIDLHHVLEESGVGAVIHNLPIERDARELAMSTGERPDEFALYGGEDFELLFTLSRENLEELRKKMNFLEIGEIVKEGLRFNDGREIRLDGYDHFKKDTLSHG